MGRSSGAAGAIAEGINGYIRGMQLKAGMDAAEQDRQWREEQRQNDRTDRQRADSLRNDLTAAAAPVNVEQGAGGMTKPETADNRDVGQPGDVGAAAGGLTPGVRVAGKAYTDPAAATAAATAANAPDAVAQRQADAYRRAGKPLEAQQLDTANTQGKLAKFELDKKQTEFMNEKFDQKLATITTPDQLAGVLSGSPLAGGKDVSIVKTPDGKKFQMMVPGEDGTMVKFGQELGTDPKDISKMLTTYSQSMKPAEKIGAMQHMMAFEEQQKQFLENKRLQEKSLGIQSAHLGIAQGQLAVSQAHEKLLEKTQEESLKNDPMHNLPGAVKMTVGGLDKALSGIDGAITKAQAEGQWDPKSQGAQDLLARKAQMENRRNTILKPYIEDAGTSTGNDYMGYGAGKGTAAPAGPQTAAGKAVAAAPPGSVTIAPPQGAAAGTAAATPAPGAGPQDPPQGPQLDQARAAYDSAQRALMTWGTSQRKKDPQGYAVAVQAAEQAKAARDQAEAAWAAAVPQGGAGRWGVYRNP